MYFWLVRNNSFLKNVFRKIVLPTCRILIFKSKFLILTVQINEMLKIFVKPNCSYIPLKGLCICFKDSRFDKIGCSRLRLLYLNNLFTHPKWVRNILLSLKLKGYVFLFSEKRSFLLFLSLIYFFLIFFLQQSLNVAVQTYNSRFESLFLNPK